MTHNRKSWQPWFRERVERKRVTWTEPYCAPIIWRDLPRTTRADHAPQWVQTAPGRFMWEDTWALFDQRKQKD